MLAETPVVDGSQLESLEREFRSNRLKMDIRLQEAQFKQLDRALALDRMERSFGSAGSQDAMEALYAPEDYVDIMDYRRDNYGYQAYAAMFTTKTDRKDGRNWPYWVSEPELAAIRGTVRLLAAYNKTCFGLLNKLRNYTVGNKGFIRKVVSRNDAPKDLLRQVETVLDEFDELNRITADLDQECIVRNIRDGEVALGLWHRGGGRVDLRVVEPDQISEPTNKGELEDWLRASGEEDAAESTGLPFLSNWSFGVHTTAGDVCDRHGYYVQWDSDSGNWDYLPGGNYPCYPPGRGTETWLEFLKSNTDRNIKRGVSDFWATTGDVELARKLIRNLAHAGALQAAIAWIREMVPGQTQAQVNSATMSMADWQTRTITQSGGTRTDYQHTYQPGTTLYLGANQKFIQPPWMHQGIAAGLLGIYEAMLRSIGQIWSLPEHMITGSAANNNMASILEAGSPFVREVETRQGWHIGLWTSVFWKVVRFNWKAGRVGSGMSWEDIKASVEIRLTGPQVDVRDRTAETARNISLVKAGLMSPVEACAREGLDYDDMRKQGAQKEEVPSPFALGNFTREPRDNYRDMAGIEKPRLESEEGDGHWVTLDNGARVFIEDGKITKGPEGFIGKSREEISGGKGKKKGKAPGGVGKKPAKKEEKVSGSSGGGYKVFKSYIEADKWGDAHYDTRKLNDRQIDAIGEYVSTAGNYEAINAALRMGQSAGGIREDRIIQSLTEAIDKYEVPENVVTYRGMSLSGGKAKRFRERYGGLKVGDVIMDKGFMSTTLEAGYAKEFSEGLLGRGAVLEIRVPKGAKGLYADSFFENMNEQELILQRGTKLRLVERKTKTHLIFEVAS